MDGDLAPIIGAVAAMAAGWGYLEVLRRRLIRNKTPKSSNSNTPTTATEYVIDPGKNIDLKSGKVFYQVTGGKGSKFADAIKLSSKAETP